MGASGVCTAISCPVKDGYFSSPPSLAGSGVFLVAFGILIPANFFTGMRYNTPLYSSTIILGLLFECIGYVGRVLLDSDVASVSSFTIYMLGTTIGPAFITSAVYQILPHIVVLYGTQFTLLEQPAWFSVVFWVLDLLTLVFQAAGVALAVVGSTDTDTTRGINILLTGLGLQLASITLFLAIYWFFTYKLRHRTYIVDPTFQDIYLSGQYKIFLLCINISTLFILTRTAARLASLLHGFSSPLNQSQPLTLTLDGALVLISCLLLTIIPAGAVFRSAWSATAPHFSYLPHTRAGGGRRSGHHRRPANISLPVSGPQVPRHAYSSPGSPPYYYSVAASSSPAGQPLMSPPIPTPPLQTFTPRSPPYHQLQQQQMSLGGGGGTAGGTPLSPPIKTSPGFARAAPPYGGYVALGGQMVQGQTQGQGQGQGQYSPGHGRQTFIQGHRRQQHSTSLVNSEALW